MRKIFTVSLCAIFFLTIFSCSKKEEGYKLEPDSPAYELAKELSKTLPYLDPDKNNVLVTTNEFDVTVGELLKIIYDNFGMQSDQIKNLDSARMTEFILTNAEGLAEQKLLLREAEKTGITITEAEIDSILNYHYSRAGGEERFLQWLEMNNIEIEAVRKDVENSLTITKFLEQELADELEVTEEEIQSAYQEDKTATVRHILLRTTGQSDSMKQETYKKMEDIREKAIAGEDFAELAKKYSEDPESKPRGGLYENFGKGEMVKPFEDAAFSLPIGEISDIIETQYGFHILKAIERQKEGKPLEEIQPQLEQKLKNEKRNGVFQNYVDSLKKEYNFNMIVSL